MVNTKHLTFGLSIWTIVFLSTRLTVMAVHKVEFIMEVAQEAYKYVETCLDEMNLDFEPVYDLMYYWHDDFAPKNENTGCVILCTLRKLKLLNARGYYEKPDILEGFPAIRNISKQTIKLMKGMYDQCVEANEEVKEFCSLVLHRVKCFTDTFRREKFVIEAADSIIAVNSKKKRTSTTTISPSQEVEIFDVDENGAVTNVSTLPTTPTDNISSSVESTDISEQDDLKTD